MTPGRRALLVALAAVTLAVLAVGLLEGASAQTDPPTLGDGDWTVRDDTVIRDWDVVMLRGDLWVTDGGSLTLANTTLLFVMARAGDHGIVVDGGGSIHIVEGATVGSSRPNVPWTFAVEEGCTLEIRDSSIEECGKPAFGLRPVWREIALFVDTSDAVVENTTFFGGLVGLHLAPGIVAPPVRNCTFENAYGIVSHGTGVEDCTFRYQSLYGVVFMGGTEGYVARCRFENVFGTCLQVGYEYFEPHVILVARARVTDCSFAGSARAIRVLYDSNATITDCTIDGMEREGLVVMTGASVEMFNGRISNAFIAVLSEMGSELEWVVDGEATVVGGSITLSGDLTLLEGARMDLLEIRNLTMLSTSTAPLWLNLHEGSLLRIVNGSIEIPPSAATPGTWAPVRLGPRGSGVEGALHLEGLDTFDVRDDFVLRNLTAIGCTLPVGKLWVETLYLEDCDLVPDPRGAGPSLTVGGLSRMTESWFIGCRLTGIPRLPPGAPLLTVASGTVWSYDFLYDVGEMVDEGAILLSGGEGGPAELHVHWSASTHVHWQNQMPLVGVTVSIRDATGTNYPAITDMDGFTPVVHVLTETATSGSGVSSRLPLEFGVRVHDLLGTVRVEEVTGTLLVDIPVVDLEPPVLDVDQGLEVATNSTNLSLTGRVHDAHSGVAFLEVALVPADYLRVPFDAESGLFQVTIELRRGHQSVSLRVYDSVGNRRTRTVGVDYSTEVPYLFIDEPLKGSWVNTTMIFVVGQTEPGSTVEAQGRETLAENGTFRILIYLREGSNLVPINVTSPAGNHNSTPVMVYLDTSAPSLDIIYPPHTPFATRFPGQSIRGKTETGTGVFINSALMTVDAEGGFSSNVALDQGAKRYLVVVVDRAGNTNRREVVFLLDSLPPSLVVLVNGGDATRYTDDELLRTSADSVTITVRTDEGVYVEVEGKPLELEGNEGTVVCLLEEGLNGIMVRVEDEAGNFREFGPINVEVDRTPPVLSLDPGLPSLTEDALLAFLGSTEPNVTVLVNGARIPVDSEGGFRKNFLLNEGVNRLVVTAQDRYGQNTTVVYEVRMIPPEPEPWIDPPSNIPLMLALTVAILVVEAVVLQLWWRHRRARGNVE